MNPRAREPQAVPSPVDSPSATDQGGKVLDDDPIVDHSSRREFLRLSGLAVGATGLALPAAVLAESVDEAARSECLPPPTLTLCSPSSSRATSDSSRGSSPTRDGGRRNSHRWPKDRLHSPSSSVAPTRESSPELVFDQGVGDLFVVRVAGNVVSGAGPFVKGSVEFAVAELGARLVVVLGHEACGAVKAAVAHIDANDTLPGSIRDLVEVIRPAAAAVRGKPGDKLDNAIKANVQMGVERLKGLDPILSGFVKKGELKVVGAVYELRTGLVRWLD